MPKQYVTYEEDEDEEEEREYKEWKQAKSGFIGSMFPAYGDDDCIHFASEDESDEDSDDEEASEEDEGTKRLQAQIQKKAEQAKRKREPTRKPLALLNTYGNKKAKKSPLDKVYQFTNLCLEDYVSAKKEMEKVFKRNKSGEAQRLFGKIEYQLGNTVDCLGYIDKGFDLDSRETKGKNEKELYELWIKAYIDTGMFQQANKMFGWLNISRMKDNENDEVYETTWRMGKMFINMGLHREALKVMDEVVACLEKDKKQMTHDTIRLYFCYKFQGDCYLALGNFPEAAKKYAGLVSIYKQNPRQIMQVRENVNELMQCLFLLYWTKVMYNNLEENVKGDMIEKGLSQEFKNDWAIENAQDFNNRPLDNVASMIQQGLDAASQKGFYQNIEENQETGNLLKKPQIKTLFTQCQKIGSSLDYKIPCLLLNKRRQLTSGCAALEISSLLEKLNQKHLEHVQQDATNVSVNKNFGKPLDYKDVVRCYLGWRQFMDPGEKLLWTSDLDQVDLARTSRSIHRGANTSNNYQIPLKFIQKGQRKDQRYFGYFKKCRDAILSCNNVYDLHDNKKQLKLDKNTLKTAQDPGPLVKAADSQTAAQLEISYQMEGKEGFLQGKRVVITQSNCGSKIDGKEHVAENFDMYLETPYSVQRIQEYEPVLDYNFNRIFELQAGQADKRVVMDQVLSFVFYFLNAQPLYQGTAMCGGVIILAFIMLSGLRRPNFIQNEIQIEWEAYLSTSPEEFISRVKLQLYDPVILNDKENKQQVKDMKRLEFVETFEGENSREKLLEALDLVCKPSERLMFLSQVNDYYHRGLMYR